jgi:hypothetical protein
LYTEVLSGLHPISLLQEFLKNKATLASAARRELGGADRFHHTADEDDVGICLEGEPGGM